VGYATQRQRGPRIWAKTRTRLLTRAAEQPRKRASAGVAESAEAAPRGRSPKGNPSTTLPGRRQKLRREPGISPLATTTMFDTRGFMEHATVFTPAHHRVASPNPRCGWLTHRKLLCPVTIVSRKSALTWPLRGFDTTDRRHRRVTFFARRRRREGPQRWQRIRHLVAPLADGAQGPDRLEPHRLLRIA